MDINTEIFKEYDVRGVYPADINADVAYRIGAAFVEFLRMKNISGPVIVGKDVRVSSEELSEAIIQAVCGQGRDVIDIGVSTTPLFYFSAESSEAGGGIMVTASHNPREYNGFKFIKKGARPIAFENGIKIIRGLAGRDIPIKISKGMRRPENYSEKYLEFLYEKADIRRPLKVVIDASNGSAGPLLNKLLSKLNIQFEALFFEPDGNFPNHPPDPLRPESLEACQKKIIKSKADLGAVLDADGDRIIFIDEKGQRMASYDVGSWYVDNFISAGDKIIIDRRASKSLREKAQEKGATPVYSRAGHTNIKKAMVENDAVFSSEFSGHYFYKDFYYSDSALMTLIRVLSLLSASDKKLSDIMFGYHKYFHTGEINFAAKDREHIIEYLKEEYSSGKKDMLDGLTVEYPEWWFNIRPSKTEPLIRLVIEAETKELMERRAAELTEKINNFESNLSKV